MATVNNAIYDELANTWWEQESFITLLRWAINPPRFAYFREMMLERLGLNPVGLSVLDVGCGGGYLAEEFARLGCRVSGIDPSRASIEAARRHAQQTELAIDYQPAFGETLPIPDECFAVVYCCDALEHVARPSQVIAEIARAQTRWGVLLRHHQSNHKEQSRFHQGLPGVVLVQLYAAGRACLGKVHHAQ